MGLFHNGITQMPTEFCQGNLKGDQLEERDRERERQSWQDNIYS